MFKHINFYFHNFEKFIVINRPKYGSRIMNMYWEAYLKKNLPNNLYLKRLNEPSFFNLFGVETNPKFQYPSNVYFAPVSNNFHRMEELNSEWLFRTNKTNLDTHKIPDPDSLVRHPDYIEHRREFRLFYTQINYNNSVLLSKLWKGKEIDIPVYVIYRNPENHFKSGLLQDTGYHNHINNRKKCFELFDAEIEESGYTGNHRGNYLSFIMPHIHHLKQLHFINLDSDSKIDFYNIFKYELNDYEYYNKNILNTGMDEKQHRDQMSHKKAYPIVEEYFNQEKIEFGFQEHYFSDIVWYNKLIHDKRNVI